ncbi:MAG: riboflavin kinase [Patescibacteria group bacterium]
MTSNLIVGRVIRGKGEGRQIGYPTANLQLTESSFRAPTGIYAVWVFLGDIKYAGVLVSGVEQEASDEPRQEVYLLDFSDDLYEQSLQVEIVQKLRDVIRTTNLEDIKKQIEQDIKATRLLLN